MFDPDELERVVSLQQKSYKLLQWVGDALRSGTLRFNTVHTAMGLSETAREWIERMRDGLPPDVRPKPDEVEAFAHLFASYLTTSFDLAAQPSERLVSKTSCYCSYCSYLASADHLRVKTPGKKAQQQAQQMKALFLASLATNTGVQLSHERAQELLSDARLAADVSHATYGHELLRRSRFASQGEGVLVLWREIAWDSRGRVKKGFVLSSEPILEAEARIVARLKEVSHA